MTQLHGRAIADVRRHVGSLRQLARVDEFTETNGPARGNRRLRLVTGGGLEIEIHPDRALDLGQATFDGVPIAWIAPRGIVSPEAYEPSGAEFMRTFGGGLLATCGLDTFGAPSVDGGVAYGTHGRIGVQRALIETITVRGGLLVVEGVVTQSRVFGENLVLHRRIEADVGGSTIRLTDTVRNDGHEPAPHMVLYHANFGWPLLDADSVLELDSGNGGAVISTSGVDRLAAVEIGEWDQFHEPAVGAEERVYLHEFGLVDSAKVPRYGIATLSNERLGVGASIRFDRRTLGQLFEWKMLGQGTYVLGLEPANSPTMTGRADARSNGTLPLLAPGSSVTHRLEFVFHRN